MQSLRKLFPGEDIAATKCGPVASQNRTFATISGYLKIVLAFFIGCGNNSRISMLSEFPDKSKGCLMLMQTRPVSAVTQTSGMALAANEQHWLGNILTRFTAAPTVADTSVSRQTGLTGIWNHSSDPASLTLSPQSGVASQMRNNTLVVRPDNLRAAHCCHTRSINRSTTTSPRWAHEHI